MYAYDLWIIVWRSSKYGTSPFNKVNVFQCIYRMTKNTYFISNIIVVAELTRMNSYFHLFCKTRHVYGLMQIRPNQRQVFIWFFFCVSSLFRMGKSYRNKIYCWIICRLNIFPWNKHIFPVIRIEASGISGTIFCRTQTQSFLLQFHMDASSQNKRIKYFIGEIFQN